MMLFLRVRIVWAGEMIVNAGGKIVLMVPPGPSEGQKIIADGCCYWAETRQDGLVR